MDSLDRSNASRDAYKQIKAKSRRVDSLVESMLMKRWQASSPDHLPQLLHSREEAEKYLTHEHAGTRLAAIEVLSRKWGLKCDEAFRAELKSLAFSDPDEKVRLSALGEIAGSYRGTDDVCVGNLLAKTVYDSMESLSARWIAYVGLLILRRMPIPDWPGGDANPSSRPRIPEDIDWPYVDSFLVADRTPLPVDGIDVFPESMRSLVRSTFSGEAAYKRGEFAKAIIYFTEALQLCPDAVALLRKRGHAYLEVGTYDAAIADLSLAISWKPTRESFLWRSDAYLKAGLMILAEEDQDVASKLEQNSRRMNPE